MRQPRNYQEFKEKYTDYDIQCAACESYLSVYTNYRHHYVCPVLDMPYCDKCWGQLDASMNRFRGKQC